MENKILAFEYTIYQLIDWYKSLVPTKGQSILSDFSKLKLFKLHFFVAAVNSGSKGEDLLNIFNRFYALPYGPVEGYIYDHINELQFYSVYNDHIDIKSDAIQNFNGLDESVQAQINAAIEALRGINDELVTFPAFRLVEISHKWPVWKLLYAQAQKKGRRNEFMPSELIRISPKFFE